MLELRHVYTSYGKVECLKGVTLQVKEGEIVALLGANGAGKTTVLKTISGLIRPTAGEILFRGDLLTVLSPEAVVRACSRSGASRRFGTGRFPATSNIVGGASYGQKGHSPVRQAPHHVARRVRYEVREPRAGTRPLDACRSWPFLFGPR